MNSSVPNKIGSSQLHFTSIASTNQYALDLISKTRPTHGTVISTSYQTQGRGQIGRSWHSAPGENVCLSIILFPRIQASQQFQLSATIALALRDYIHNALNTPVSVKWPNDVYVGDRKIAGVLIQNTISGQTIRHSVIGIGLNVNQCDFPESLPNPTSLCLESHQKYRISEVQGSLLTVIGQWLNRMDSSFPYGMTERFEQHLFRKGMVSEFEDLRSGKKFSACILGVNMTGKLLLEVDREEKAFTFNEIRYTGHDSTDH